jgi:hypothetical protein
LVSLSVSLSAHDSQTKRHICLRVIFLNLVLNLLMQPHTPITYQNVLDNGIIY